VVGVQAQQQQQQLNVLIVKPPLYRVFWLLHNAALVSTPISFGMFISRFYEGQSRRHCHKPATVVKEKGGGARGRGLSHHPDF